MNNLFNIISHKIVFFCILSIYLFPVSHASSQHENNTNIRIATSSSIPPYFIKDQNKGIVADIIKKSFETQGYDVTFTYLSNNEIQRNLLTKHVVGAFNFPKKNSSKLYYTKPIVYYENIAVTLSENNYNIESLSDLKGLNIGLFENAFNFLGKDLKHMVKNFKSYTEYKNQEEQVKALLKKEVDAIILEKNIFDFYYHKIEKKCSEDNPKISKHFIFPRSERPIAFLNKKLRNEFNKGFLKVQESGDYYKILHKYVD